MSALTRPSSPGVLGRLCQKKVQLLTLELLAQVRPRVLEGPPLKQELSALALWPVHYPMQVAYGSVQWRMRETIAEWGVRLPTRVVLAQAMSLAHLSLREV